MEDLKSANVEFWGSITIDLSENHETAVELEHILKQISDFESINVMHFSNKQNELLYKAALNDFPILNKVRGRKDKDLYTSLKQEEIDSVKSILRWTLFEIKNFEPSVDPKLNKIAIVLFVSNILDDNLWLYFDLDCVSESVLPVTLSKLFKSFHLNFDSGGVNSPIWEREAVERYKEFVEISDWKGLADNWNQFKYALGRNENNIYQSQAFKFLLHFDMPLLVESTSFYGSFLEYANIIKQVNLSFIDRFKLARLTTNDNCKFALLFSLELEVDGSVNLSDDEANEFARVLDNISTKDYFEIWLCIFNRYPFRFRVLNRGFGVYLAKYASFINMNQYLASIDISRYALTEDQTNKSIVSQVFKTFHENSTPAQRNVFWELCLKKWKGYIECMRNEKTALSDAFRTDFDIAIVGYYSECLSNAVRQQVIHANLSLVASCFDKWHESMTDMGNYFYILLSELQPVYHAISIEGNYLNDWDVSWDNGIFEPLILQEDKRFDHIFELQWRRSPRIK